MKYYYRFSFFKTTTTTTKEQTLKTNIQIQMFNSLNDYIVDIYSLKIEQNQNKTKNKITKSLNSQFTILLFIHHYLFDL
jgi:hypothetical protein